MDRRKKKLRVLFTVRESGETSKREREGEREEEEKKNGKIFHITHSITITTTNYLLNHV